MPVNEDLATETWVRFQECRDFGHLGFLEKADRCDKFTVGKQWLQEDLDRLNLAKRPALTINKILSTLKTVFGEQINNRAEVLFRPASGAATSEIADALNKVWMQIAQNNQLQWVRSELFADGQIRSRGFIDARLDFTDSMQGDVRITNLNSKNVVIDPDAEEYDPDSWNDVIVSKWLTVQDIELNYSKADAEYLKDKEGSSFIYGYDSIARVRDRFGGTNLAAQYYNTREPHGLRRNVRVIDRQYRRLDTRLHFVDVKTGDLRPVPEGWDRDRIAFYLMKMGGAVSTMKKRVRRVRWTVVADNVVLHDDWSPYKHFTVVPYFPFFRYGETVGTVENLLSPQEMLNKTSSQELHVINTTANSGWKLKVGALKNMSVEELEQKGATTGLVLELDDINSAEKIQPNQTPTGLDRLSYKAEEHIKTISSVSDSMQGFDREDVAAKAIAYKQQRGASAMAKDMDNLARTDWILARNVLDIVQEYYTEERLVQITHSDAENTTEEIYVNQYDPVTETIKNDLTLGEYSIVVTSTPARDTMEDSQFEQAVALREQGVPIPDSFLIENSRLARKAELIKAMESAQSSPEAQQEAELATREREAAVGKLEAETGDKQATTQLRMAQVEKTQAETENLLAEGAGDNGAAEREFALKEQEHAQKASLAERTFALKEREHQQGLELAARKYQDQAAAARAKQLVSNSQPAQKPRGDDA